MADLKLRECGELIGQDVEIGDVILASSQPENIVSIMPFKGRGIAVNETLKSLINIGLPTVGSVSSTKQARVMWTGHGQWFVVGSFSHQTLANALSEQASVTDQSDAWVVLNLTGADVHDLLARLCPLDISTLGPKQTARSEFADVFASITPVAGGIEVMVMRSYAKTVVQHVEAAMRRLAAQKAL